MDTVPVPRLRTERLLLREWQPADLEPFAALNADPEVAALLGEALTRAESDALVDRIVAGWRDHGFGLWAVARADDDILLGFTGLSVPSWAPDPAPEIGWRLARHAWDRGYATEAAQEALRFAFQDRGFDEIVSYTTVSNARSRRVMDKLGMARRDPGAPFDFLHPSLPADHALRPHVTYRITRDRWQAHRPATRISTP